MAKHFKQDTGRSMAPSRRVVTPRSRRTRRRGSVRGILTLVLALAVVGAAVGGVVAWLTVSGQVQNQFEVGEVKPTVNEKGSDDGDFESEVDTVKKDVTVTNSGNVPIYVRAQVNIYWQDANGSQLWDGPEDDYELVMGTSQNWVRGPDGFYYWTKPLAAGDTTDKLLDSLTNKSTDEYPQLVCDIAVQGIQADPTDAVEEAWGVNVGTDGTLDTSTQAGD